MLVLDKLGHSTLCFCSHLRATCPSSQYYTTRAVRWQTSPGSVCSVTNLASYSPESIIWIGCQSLTQRVHMPILDAKTLDFVSNSAAQTERLGVRLGEHLQSGDLLCLEGELGAGKTCLARGISRGWGATRSATSPSFTLVNEYPRALDDLPLFHLDCYRLQGPGDALSIGLDDILDQAGVTMIEWPERIEAALPTEHLWITLRWTATTKRGICFEASGDRYAKLLADFRLSAFGV